MLHLLKDEIQKKIEQHIKEKMISLNWKNKKALSAIKT